MLDLEKRWHVEVAATSAGAQSWGEVVCEQHPAGGAGTSLPGIRIMWNSETGRKTCQRIVNDHNESINTHLAATSEPPPDRGPKKSNDETELPAADSIDPETKYITARIPLSPGLEGFLREGGSI